MSNFFARWCGHANEIRDLENKLHRTQIGNLGLEGKLRRQEKAREAAEKRLLETSTELISTRAQRDDLNELLQETTPNLNAVIDLLINAKRVTGLNHSGPALARQRIDQAINLLEGEK